MDLNETSCHSTTETDVYKDLRFWVVLVAGTLLSLVGIIQNTLLYYLFSTRTKFRQSAIFFLSYVALFDALFDLGYILCTTVRATADHWQLVVVYDAWANYYRYAMPLTKICKLCSTLCLIAASLERYHAASQWTFAGFQARARMLLLCLCCVLGLVVRGPIYLSIQLVECTDTGTHHLRVDQQLVSNTSGLLHILGTLIGIVLPFAALIYLNVAIVVRLHRQRVRELRSLMFKLAVSKSQIDEHDGRIRHATKTLACLVLAYALSNALDLVLALWELLDRESLSPASPAHSFTNDLVSVCTVLGNVVRLHIYAQCDPEIHRALHQLVCLTPLLTNDLHSSSSVDNIEQALHRGDTICRLRRLSRLLAHEDSLDVLQRQQLHEGIDRTMSDLHLDQQDTLRSPITIEHNNYLSLRHLSSEEPVSPRAGTVPLRELFFPDIDLLSHDISMTCYRLKLESSHMDSVPGSSHRTHLLGNGHLPHAPQPKIIVTSDSCRLQLLDDEEL